ncbi:ABC transporter permease [Pseudohalocynthiibacter aestuariivivens]|uniref:ABC transporter permease n=1 Tax=Roseovarius pelagicus TaxID=2980108 RepID=A0ABY6D6K7_9RHOB|nr:MULTISPECIES: ABC transporter permease [Rhodobacterales]QIE46254.1 ABC transporter permease [Pseudohalocynthiibacter aestuariivivens]UXX81771.1 ABC transporter permease [Roseovarius pelagicus]
MNDIAISSSGKNGRLNADTLRRKEVMERFGATSLTFPGLFLIALVLLVPVLWLFWLSAYDAAGDLSWANYERMGKSIYVRTFTTTFRIAIIVTVCCAILGYPVAYLMSQAGRRLSLVILLSVLLPFWTSVLVRTYAWLVLLQRTGLINTWLQSWGIIDTPLALVHNEFGTIIGMIHVMLPFMILPLYASMKAVDPSLMLAASNCGATPTTAFWQIYFPQTVSGLSSGAGLIFVLCLGFFVTPVLLGGGRTYMWAMQIADNISLYGNWGAASALGVVLVIATAMVLLAVQFVLRRAGGSK